LEQELEAIVVRLGLGTGFEDALFAWLQPGPPEEADRRDKTARGGGQNAVPATSSQMPLHTKPKHTILECFEIFWGF
jgi:hypothetical protein